MPTALFVSAGGYHHHLGLNTWHSQGAPPAPPDTASLRFYTLAMPSQEALDAVVARLSAAGIAARRKGDAVVVSDPWQNVILLHVGPVADARTANQLFVASG